jgi:uncharacterized protein (UPF0332 family)/predicted nucleotidyltransferase
MVGKNKNRSNIKASSKDIPTLKIVNERDIAFDFGTKVYRKFDKLIKSVVLFGSTAKNNRTLGSDIDIIILVDDATIKFDSEMIAWYREELRKLVESNPYKSELHINTVKLTTWWNDLLHGDPVVINIIRYGEPMLDFGGFFNPLKILLEQGKIKPTPEAIYNCLQRAPQHLARSKQAELSSVEGVYWAMVDSAHALLIAAGLMPPSPEHIPIMLKENFVDKRILESEYISWFREAYILHKEILHGQIKDIKGQNLDQLQERADKFLRRMAELIESYIK